MKRILILVLVLLNLTICGCNNGEINSKKSTDSDTIYETAIEFFPETSHSVAENATNENEFSGFNGVSINSPTPEFGNDQQHLAGTVSYPGLVCPDNNSGYTYYTALGYDNYLHRTKGGTDEILIKKTAWGINVINEKLYCIINSNAPVKDIMPYSFGDIYVIDLETKEEQLIMKTRASSLAVTENKMYFVYDTGTGDTFYNQVYECDLDGQNIVPVDSAFIGAVGNYHVAYNNVGENNFIENTGSDEKVQLTEYKEIYNFTGISNNECCYQFGGTGLRILDISNGDTVDMMPSKEYNKIMINDTDSYSADGHFISGHYILNDNAYIVFGEIAFRIGKDGKTDIYYAPDNKSSYYDSLYYDGVSFYTVKSVAMSPTSGKFKLVRIEFDDEIYGGTELKTLKEYDIL